MTCKGCTGTCCTGEGSEPCTCEDDEITSLTADEIQAVLYAISEAITDYDESYPYHETLRAAEDKLQVIASKH